MALSKCGRQQRELKRAIARAQYYRSCLKHYPPEPLHRLQFYEKKLKRLAALIGPVHGTAGGRR